MDLKTILSRSEDGLPTLEQNLSTSTAVDPGLPTITADRTAVLKFGGSVVMGVAGMLYLGYGKKNNDVRRMIIGAALTLGSIFVF